MCCTAVLVRVSEKRYNSKAPNKDHTHTDVHSYVHMDVLVTNGVRKITRNTYICVCAPAVCLHSYKYECMYVLVLKKKNVLV